MIFDYYTQLTSNAGSGSLVAAAAVVLVLYWIQHVTYNLYFHPLRQFPGPLLHRATCLPFLYHLFRGSLVFHVKHLHDQYGPVVRVAYNDLAFTDPRAWEEIYNRESGRSSGSDEMTKSTHFYHDLVVSPQIFTETALQNQDSIIKGYVDVFTRKLREQCATEGVDTPETKCQVVITDWYNWLAFDVVCDLVLGNPFGCLETTRNHPMLALVYQMFKFFSLAQALKYLKIDWIIMPFVGLVRLCIKIVASPLVNKMTKSVDKRFGRGNAMVLRLLNEDGSQPDLEYAISNAGVVIASGTETLSALLSGITYLLLQNPNALQRLVDEVRSTFKSDAEITVLSVQRLPYLRACINEALRRYPPVPVGLPRVVPKGGASIAGHDIPQNTNVACWHYAVYHSGDNWSDPYSYEPERFLGANGKPGDRLESHRPFSAGTRNCLGKSFGPAVARLALARTLFSFDMTLAEPKSEWLDQKTYTVWMKNDLRVHLAPRL
ncbi:cytochrome p450 domain-containing protein [Hirsutella rhossiliensis]|uniref:Cytochrome p450 domain-containing protein n=1 Tax=Hirsutella rhossiliensis TaxID=111463 RepID=A0A9P8MRT2_9HYPO|nr:cytochrome p450 domain-containing protein [Hirsutella rhossiliensis]KAH0960030.1 cytochrome p450 domain-containing protein [Hirsutella rhossiliensis]